MSLYLIGTEDNVYLSLSPSSLGAATELRRIRRALKRGSIGGPLHSPMLPALGFVKSVG
jgi:hypothetical protein